jgi:hypothetical protein
VASHLAGEHVSVYVPTTPNPTSGFFLIMARNDVVPLNMSVDAALKYVISMGVVVPGGNANGNGSGGGNGSAGRLDKPVSPLAAASPAPEPARN